MAFVACSILFSLRSNSFRVLLSQLSQKKSKTQHLLFAVSGAHAQFFGIFFLPLQAEVE